MASDGDHGGGGGSGVGADALFFVGIIVLFFIVWVASGGPSRPISFEGPYLRPISNTGESAQAYGDPNTGSRFSTGISIGGFGGRVSTGASGSGIRNRSSASETIQFKSETAGAKKTDKDEEYVTITLSSKADAPISTAGWVLMSETTGKSTMLPQGAEVPQSGRVNQLAPIVLSPGQSAVIVTGRSPVGVSFRENMCTGYFEERQDFHPSLPRSCPSPFQEYKRIHGEGNEECVKYVRSISACTTPTRTPSDISNSCENFVEDYISYNGCLDEHADDEKFKGSRWRIFLGKNDELWRDKGETILLLDAAGNTIDSLSY